jgi:CubicO group peptidase (beta-lactamase class C family)
MFLAAGEIVPAVTGKSWDEFVKERIFTPLGMTRTTTTVRELPRMENVATPHNESGGKLRPIPYGNVDGAGGAANMNSSVHDLAQWMRLQLGRGAIDGKRILSAAASRTMWSPHTISGLSPEAEELIPSRHFSLYGLGWGLSDYLGKKIVSHGGALDGMFSATALVPEANFGIVVLTNSETSAYAAVWRKAVDLFLDAPARDWSAEMLQQYREDRKEEQEEEKKVETARVGGTKPSLALAQYAGTYTGDLYGDVTVTLENGGLVLRFTPSQTLVGDLEHWHYDTFLIKWRPSVSYNFTRRGFVTFILGTDGKVTEMKIDQPNPDFHFFELELKRKEK